jgi:hypothetical protein
MHWHETEAYKVTSQLGPQDHQEIVHLCQSATLKNEDKIYPGAFVIYTLTGAQFQEIGKIWEIIAQNSSQLIGTLIQKYTLGDPIIPYHLPALIPSVSFMLASLKVHTSVLHHLFPNHRED